MTAGPVGAASEYPPPHHPLFAGHGGPATHAFEAPTTCADATQKTTPIIAQSSLKIALKDPKNDPLTEVVVKIGSKTVVDVKGVKKIKKGITLKKKLTGKQLRRLARCITEAGGLPDGRCSTTGVLVSASTELVAVGGTRSGPAELSRLDRTVPSSAHD